MRHWFWLMLITATAQAEVYRWTDAGGVTHYSAEPPPAQQPYQALELEPPPVPEQPSGLRPGEREWLQEIRQEEQRQERQDAQRARAAARERRREAEAAEQQQHRCADYQRRLRRVEHRLATGYAPRESYRLHDLQDEYQAKIRQHCR